MDSKLPLALTQGDPAGIGPELAARLWLDRRENGVAPFIYLGDPRILVERARMIGIELPIAVSAPETALATFDTALPVFTIDAGVPVKAGAPDPKSAPGTISAIDMAVRFTMRGKTAAVVTNPIAKSVLYQSGFSYPGHTEFLAALAARETGIPVTPVMMLACPQLRVVPITIHIALSKVPESLTSTLIVETARITAHDLRSRFGIENPRLAFAGLNPHAGEDGAMGTEEETIISPALDILRADGIDVIGPLPADTMFHATARQNYDVALCMYHDQALIPVKTLGFDDGVNATLGLPFIRTSPDHGTAFGIAGKGVARAESLLAAITMAAAMAEASK
ncbi:4-hydroxythreonine-4-phosphate dehydrogenase PdxA [Martelella alba]|uniref:4-hydroxythreonine-4-phosphate dehydrogenase n=1 Tax=Martelella alba TaxID=2590451 RepID=A0A506UJ97_9HYPH|nr:4-hydroxythreonine-4-phosphate dehydrogenase PdxA [Martelella alba]TPW33397.1 4-hydroxythreonine-4-phosphate dehydrogenase PdxA [Martelella alba]